MSTSTETAPLKSGKVPLGIPAPYDTFKEWRKAQRIPIFRGFYIEDVNALELEYWDLKGIPALSCCSKARRHERFLCLRNPSAGKPSLAPYVRRDGLRDEGHGTTTVWQKNVESIPSNGGRAACLRSAQRLLSAFQQHGLEGARFYAVTNCCFMMNLLHSVDFIFNNDFTFIDRFDPDKPDYFGGEEKIQGAVHETNFVPDTIRSSFSTTASEARRHQSQVRFAGQLLAPISRSFGRSYRKSIVTALTPTSSSSVVRLFHFVAEGAEPTRVDWKPGTVVVPRINGGISISIRQGTGPLSRLAPEQLALSNGLHGRGDIKGSITSVKEGGSQMNTRMRILRSTAPL